MRKDMNFCIRQKRQAGDFMAEKKERERFSIKFNEKDKSHKLVIELLENQPPRCKAQFIVNAVLHYINCPETPDTFPLPPVDKESIRSIVLEILKQQGIEQRKEAVLEQTVNWHQDKDKATQTEEDSGKPVMDNNTLSLIADTLSAFRGN